MALDHKTLDDILDPRRTNLGAVGAALVKAAQDEADAAKFQRMRERIALAARDASA